MKIELTIEQSAKLVELGVDPKLASKTDLTDDYNEQWENFQHPIFTLTDLLSILPKEINGRILTITSTDKLYFAFYASWEKEYEYSTEDTVTHQDGDEIFSAPELIDSLYQLLIWCLSEKKNQLNLNKEL